MEQVVTYHHYVDVKFIEGLGFGLRLSDVGRDVDGLESGFCLGLLLNLRIRRPGIVFKECRSYKESVAERQAEYQNCEKDTDKSGSFTFFLL